MFTKFSKFVSVLMIATLFATFGAGSIWAQDMTMAPGDDSANALAPADGIVQIEAGTWDWYTFRSQVPVDAEEDDDAVVTDPEEATIDIALYVKSGAVDFEVWSAEDLNNWQNNVDFDATGVGTTNEFMPNDPLFWQGSFQNNNTYYLIVKNHGPESASYSLDITGHVTFPSSASPSEEMLAEEMAAEPTMSEPEMMATPEADTSMADDADMGDMGMEAATGIPTGDVQIEAGTWDWYTFRSQVPVDAEEDDDAVVTDPEEATIDIALYVKSGAVDFEVWSAEDLNNWQNNVDFDATGVGTTNEFMPNDPLFWQGSFQNNNTYYLIVKNHGPESASYSLDITGHVTFPE